MRATQRDHQGQTPQGPDHQGLKQSVRLNRIWGKRCERTRAETAPINIY